MAKDMDISLQIIVIAANHDLSHNPLLDASRHRPGDIVQALLRANTKTPKPFSPLGFIHIDGVHDGPDPVARFAKIQKILGSEIRTTQQEAIIVPLIGWQAAQSIGDKYNFIDTPTESMTPDVFIRLSCNPVDLVDTQAKFNNITFIMQNPVTLIYTLEGTATAVKLSGSVPAIARKRAWRIPPNILPGVKKNKLIANREITVTWAQVKPFIRKKRVTIDTDRTADDETTELTDGEIA